MSLRQRATEDNRRFLEDSVAGFGWPVTITDPAGKSANLTGFTNDIHASFDPETGVLVSGRKVSVVLHQVALADAGLCIPVGVHDDSRKPWLVSFPDTNGNEQVFKISDALPDDAASLVACLLESYSL